MKFGLRYGFTSSSIRAAARRALRGHADSRIRQLEYWTGICPVSAYQGLTDGGLLLQDDIRKVSEVF